MKESSTMGSGLILVMTLLMSIVLILFSMLSFTAAQSDLALSSRMLELEESYFEASHAATLLLREFEAGDLNYLAESIPMGEFHALEVVFERDYNGSAVVSAWNTIVIDDEAMGEEDSLPLLGFDFGF